MFDALELDASCPLSQELRRVVEIWANGQHRLVVLSAAFADSDEWIHAGAPTAAHWLADLAGIEVSTAREWIRVGRSIRTLPSIAAAFADGRLSYSKVRTLTRIAEAGNEDTLVALAERVPAGELGRALAAWVRDHSDPEELDAYQQRRRSVRWRTEPDGMVIFTMRLPPFVAGLFAAALTAIARRARPITRRSSDASAGGWPSLAQQHADAVEVLLNERMNLSPEVVVHVRGDGASMDDGTPLTDSVVERIAPDAFIRALVHDAEGRPINASWRRRHPDARQRRVAKERDRVCVDCGRGDLLQFDHNPPFERSGRTVVDELELRCAPCHQRRHRAA